VEAVDPVRFLSNRSSGKMGFAIAEQVARLGARVTLVTGPVALPTPSGVGRIDVRAALEMREALQRALGATPAVDALVMAAAVADFRPRVVAREKLSRNDGNLSLELVPNPDLLAEIGAARGGSRPLLVGFALETGDDVALIASAREKLAKKRVDLIVANRADEALERDTNRATFVDARACRELGELYKPELARHIAAWLEERFEELEDEPA
jgi:phosphopantothenoylcysteine decarboxylase/phosphopantothenate--cysteine ligase